MITPEYLNEVIKNTEDIVSSVNEYILARIARRIVDSFKAEEGRLIIPATQADMKLLMKGGMLYDEIAREIENRLPEIQGAVHDAFLQSAQEMAEECTDFAKSIVAEYGIEVEVPDFQRVDIPVSARQLNMTPQEIRNLEDMYRRTNNTVKNMVRTSAKLIHQDYYNACDSAYIKAKRGIPIAQAISEAIEELAEKGIETIDYGTGHKDRVEVAVARAVRTGINQANANIVLTRCAEMGTGYVKVSEHLGARVTKYDDYRTHAKWQGQVYRLNWDSPTLQKYEVTAEMEQENEQRFGFLRKIKDFFSNRKLQKYKDFVESTGYGELLGLCGINCRHTFSPFDPKVQIDRGQTVPQGENEQRYKLEQKQRAYEREIRKVKREIMSIKESGLPDEEIKTRLKIYTPKLTKLYENYKAFCLHNGLKERRYSQLTIVSGKKL